MTIKFKDLLEYKTQRKPKKRPPSTLWFSDYLLWSRDSIQRYPDVHFQEKGNKILAVSPDLMICYGYWKEDEQKGVTFHEPRMTSIVVV